MRLFRYNCTLRQPGAPDTTLSLVAKTGAQAREKAFHRWTNGLPFWTFRLSDISVRKLESVDGVALVNP